MCVIIFTDDMWFNSMYFLKINDNSHLNKYSHNDPARY